MADQQPPLADQLRESRFEHRLDQANIVAAHENVDERTQAATRIIQEIAMQRVFDRLTPEQEAQLLDTLSPLAFSTDRTPAKPFGDGAYSKIDTKKQTRLF